MLNQNGFTIYNASAGSGKTYTLVKHYLERLLQSENPMAFKSMLALTFTNKAVNEMKSRIIQRLHEFSKDDILSSDDDLFNTLVDELKLTPEQLHKRAKRVLNHILFNYAAFEISTIDKFNHAIVRTFAKDLNLPVNFEVELDTEYLLGKAVDKLIDSAGQNKPLTKVMIDFALEKADDDRSWDISYDFNNIAQLITKETHAEQIEALRSKSLSDFLELKHHLIETLKLKQTQLVTIAKDTLLLIDNKGIAHSDFSGQYLPKYFIKLSQQDFNVSLENAWQEKLINGDPIHPVSRVKESTASLIEAIRSDLITAFTTTKEAVIECLFIKSALKNCTPVSVLNAINQTLVALKEEDDILLISEFNTLINTVVKAQPIPFIYERLGEKFKHFFIDEFQDTSVMQWENLKPLADNALSSQDLKGNSGSLLLVGDAKQAIYRWRGGDAELFINLYNKKANPFHVEINTKTLDFNYRSTKTIVEFNNTFFKHISSFVFSNPDYALLYKNCKQEIKLKEEGYVELSFLELKNEDKTQLHCEKVLNCVTQAQANGFSLGDICVIVRKNDEALDIANFLTLHDVLIMSSESLLLKNAPEVLFLNTLLALTIQQENEELKLDLLIFLAEYKLDIDNKHVFYAALVHLNLEQLFKALQDYDYHFNLSTFFELPLYEAVEYAIYCFNLAPKTNAYLQSYLDVVLAFSQKKQADINSFLELWARKKDALSIALPETSNAVNIMTIHKSKGLEFPVVIFPFSNRRIYDSQNPTLWFNTGDRYAPFQHLFLNMNSNVALFGEYGAALHQEHLSHQELDAINLLYVVLTRAEQQLYIINELDLGKDGEKLKYFSGLFISYLKQTGLWNNQKHTYSFGCPKRQLYKKETAKIPTVTQENNLINPRQTQGLNIITRSGSLWGTEQALALEEGNTVHALMALIKTEQDIDFALETFLTSGQLTPTQATSYRHKLEAIVFNKNLNQYFKPENTVYNERDMMSEQGKILRADRIVTTPQNETVLIDYKTGTEKQAHKEQLNTYAEALRNMGLPVSKKILVYVNANIHLKEV